MEQEKTFAEIFEGDSARFAVTVTKELVDAFALLSGDYNPLHTDAEFAAETPFGERIAHGMIVGALFSRLVGMHLPGKHCLYLSQTLLFKKPIHIGTEVTIEGTVTKKTDSVRTLIIRTTATDAADGTLYVEGDAMVRLLQ